jgi:hypothetical protein
MAKTGFVALGRRGYQVSASDREAKDYSKIVIIDRKTALALYNRLEGKVDTYINSQFGTNRDGSPRWQTEMACTGLDPETGLQVTFASSAIVGMFRELESRIDPRQTGSENPFADLVAEATGSVAGIQELTVVPAAEEISL